MPATDGAGCMTLFPPLAFVGAPILCDLELSLSIVTSPFSNNMGMGGNLGHVGMFDLTDENGELLVIRYFYTRAEIIISPEAIEFNLGGAVPSMMLILTRTLTLSLIGGETPNMILIPDPDYPVGLGSVAVGVQVKIDIF